MECPQDACVGMRFLPCTQKFVSDNQQYRISNRKYQSFENRSEFCFSLRYSRFDIQDSIFKIRYSRFDIQDSIFKIRYSRFDIQDSIFKIRYSRFDIQDSIFFPFFAYLVSTCCPHIPKTIPFNDVYSMNFTFGNACVDPDLLSG